WDARLGPRSWPRSWPMAAGRASALCLSAASRSHSATPQEIALLHPPHAGLPLASLPVLLALAAAPTLAATPTLTAGPTGTPLSDGTRLDHWTLTNGLRVVTRHVPG